ncbi:MAG: hypothetical protein ACREAZ_00210 [Nitrososphaera sp.]
MIASIASGVLGVLMSLAVSMDMLFISVPGFVIGAFFAFKYATHDRSKRREEEHRRSRSRHKH